jgi:SAM-dependent methyltransferase
VGAVLDLTYAAMASPFRQVATAMSTGEGVPSAAFAELGAAAGGVNTRLYRAALVDEWISAAPGLRDRLEAGGRIADLACGNGDAAAIMAGAFPRSVVKGFDPGAPEDAHADVPNLELVAGSAAGVVDEEKFDLITCLDAFHHLGDVRAAARQVHDVLAPDGVFLIAETAMSGDLDADNDDPFSLIVHAAALLYCMQENLANGGDGVTPSIGLGWVDDALAAAGFSSVTQHESDTGYRIFVATR